jgi:Na+/H+ antiporter NhaC
MDRRQFFGESVSGTIIRLVLLSIVVGIVFSALDINLFNIVERLQQLVRNIINLGFDAFHWAFKYFLLGVVVVVPIWFVVRLLSRPRDPRV